QSNPLWSPFVLSKQTESQMTDFTQLFFGQALSFRKVIVGLRYAVQIKLRETK
ncbi:hypothetical protein EV561_12474, partial [Rhizobium sp. BK376]